MAKDQTEPLLSTSRGSSDQSSERHLEEEDALLTGQQSSTKSRLQSWAFWREIGFLVWAIIATAAVVVLAVLYQHQQTTHTDGSPKDSGNPNGKRNLIFMVSDGMGPTSLSLTRSYAQTSAGLPFNHHLILDDHLIGSSRTRSSSSLITDSAAGATVFSCGHKSYNGAISVLPNHQPCGTVLEAAKRAGYLTGMVVTTRISDATPACFAAHVNQRSDEDRIAEQEIGHGHPLGQVVDLLLGGGRCHFLPNSTRGSCRNDDKDVIEIAKNKGWDYISSRGDFNNLKESSAVKLPLLGLLATEDIPYEIDRAQQDNDYPSLSEMASVALKALAAATKDNDKGFFLMIEGSRIDHAGHGNDPVAQVHEVLEYNKAFSTVLDFLDEDTVEGVLVGTSDHETGGLATARQLHKSYPEYRWFPEVLANASHSALYLAREMSEHISSHVAASEDASKTFIRSQLVEGGLGIYDATEEEIQQLYDSAKQTWPPSNFAFADMVSRRAQVGWTTHGHSAVDVNVYASDPAAAKALIGNHENTEVGGFIRDYLELDLDGITEELKKNAAAAVQEMQSHGGEGSWMGKAVSEEDTKEALDHYHGDFRKRHLQGCDCGGLH